MFILLKQITKTYNKKVRDRTLCIGDLALKTAGGIQKGLSAFTFAPNWEGVISSEKSMIVVVFLSLNLIQKIFISY